MYMPFMMCGYAFALLLMLLGCVVAMRTVPGLRGLRLLAAAMCCGLVGTLLTAARLWAPAWASILLANQLVFTGCLLIYSCIAGILGLPSRFLRSGIGLSLLAVAGDAWFTWPHPGLEQRILIGSGLCSVYAAATAFLLFRGGNPLADPVLAESTGRTLPRSLGILQCSLVLLCIARCVLTVRVLPTEFIHLDLIQAAFTYINMLLYLGTAAGLVWLSLCVHRGDLQAMARTDGLTGLLNRRAFDDLLFREMRRSRRLGGSTALLLLDIDRFKDVNDSLGHPAGDEVIRRVCAVIRESTRPQDELARYGGEEFVVMIRDCRLSQAQEAAERLRARVADLSGLPGGLRITASIGVAASRLEDEPAQLMLRCDQALYRSKRGGRNLVTVNPVFGTDPVPQPA